MSRVAGRRLRGWEVLRGGFVGLVAVVLAGCWAMPGVGPDNRNHNPVETVITTETVGSMSLRWSVEVGDCCVNAAVTSPAGVHVVTDGGLQDLTVRTLRPATGELVWSQRVAGATGGSDASPPVVVGDEVVVGWGWDDGAGWVGGLNGFDIATGERGPDIDGGRVDTARGRRLGQHSFVASDEATGEPCTNLIGVVDLDDPAASWSGAVNFLTSHRCGWESPTLGENALFHAGTGPTSTAVEPTMGNGLRAYTIAEPSGCAAAPVYQPCPTWATPLPGNASEAPVIGEDGEALYVVTHDMADAGVLHAVDASDGSILWTAPLGSSASAPALAHGALYLSTRSGLKVFAADGCGAAECSPLWTAGSSAGRPVVAGDVVFTGSSQIHAYPALGCGQATCESLWSTDLGAWGTTGPVVSGGQLYIGTYSGHLYAYGPAT